ncbi:hypothetical protein [Salinarimonas sp.]|uniref:hypothetical protein n=1 Tax=Salinarimonas sp. TaxID=2766526 RepID=UPI00391BA0CC
MADQVCQIHRFEERDIDLLLAEELRTNPAFASWFAERAAGPPKLRTPALRTRVSVVEDGSEADLIACFATESGGTFRMFVEDKITAAMMPDQLGRYARRARAEVERGEIVGYAIVLFAPASYVASQQKVEEIVYITFEEAAAALRDLSPSLRSEYRACFLEAALPIRTARGRDARTLEVEPYVAEWWEAVYRMLEREFPGYFLPPQVRYPKSVYIAPRTSGMPPYLRVDFKGHVGEVDLAVKNVPFATLERSLRGTHVPGRLISNKRSSAIRRGDLLPFTIADGHSVIDDRVKAAYAAAKSLLDYWFQNKELFDAAVYGTD